MMGLIRRSSGYLWANRRQLASFCMVGGATAGIYFSTLAIQQELFDVNYKLAVSVSYFLATTFHFLSNKLFTFGSKTSKGLTGQFTRYLILVLINYVISILIVIFAKEVLSLSSYVGVLMSVGVTLVVGYTLSKHWIFPQPQVRAP